MLGSQKKEAIRDHEQPGKTFQRRYEWAKHPLTLDGPSCPLKDTEHVSGIFDNKIVIIGDAVEPTGEISCPLVYQYCLAQGQWTKQNTTTTKTSINRMSGKYGVVVKDVLLVLAEMEVDKDRKALGLWQLNLTTWKWLQIEQSGDIPAFAEGACLLQIYNNWLVYFGGLSKGQLFNRIFLFNIGAKSWHRCQGNYQFCLKGRENSSMLFLNEKLYLFGGCYQSVEGGEELDDFYEIALTLPSEQREAQASPKAIHSELKPSARGGHLMLAVNDQDICLLGGRNGEGFQDSIWIFSVSHQEWTLFDHFEDRFLNRQGNSHLQQDDCIWVFGGLDLEQGKGGQGEMLSLELSWEQFYSWQAGCKQEGSLETGYEASCSLCYENRFSFVHHCLPFSGELIDEMASLVEFPFAAIGLLTDNAMALEADSIMVGIGGEKGSHWIKVEDNGKINWSEKELIHSITSFGSQNNPVLTGCEKRVKKIILSDNGLREYGVNLKLGCLRLGKRFLVLISRESSKTVISCSKETSPNGSAYKLEHYSINSITKELTDKGMSHAQSSIDGKYGKWLTSMLGDKSMKNLVFIFDTILDDPQEHCAVNNENSDILLGEACQIEQLRCLGYNLTESLDVSLKTYLSFLYLRNEEVDIKLAMGGVVTSIASQSFLEKVDKMCRMGLAIELEDIVEFDFKVAEFYYLKEQRKTMNFFSNGVLLYSHNRLLCRFKPKLGDMVNSILSETSGFFNYLPFFGYAELPESIPVNPFKTNFAFDIMLDKMYSRLRLVEENFKKTVTTIVVVKAHAEAVQRRERTPSNVVAPIKHLPRRLRGHYGERNWDELPDRFELDMNRRKVNMKKEKLLQKQGGGVIQQAQVQPPGKKTWFLTTEHQKMELEGSNFNPSNNPSSDSSSSSMMSSSEYKK